MQRNQITYHQSCLQPPHLPKAIEPNKLYRPLVSFSYGNSQPAVIKYSHYLAHPPERKTLSLIKCEQPLIKEKRPVTQTDQFKGEETGEVRKRKKIFSLAKETSSIYRDNSHSLENKHHSFRKASYNSNQQFNPITKKIIKHSQCSSKTLNREARAKRHKIFDDSDHGMKTIIKEYSSPETMKQQYEKQVFSSSEPNIQKTSSESKESVNQYSKYTSMARNSGDSLKERYTLNRLVEKNFLEENYSEDQTDRFYDMDLKLSLKRQSVREMNESFLATKKFISKDLHEKKQNSFVKAFKELLKSQDNDGKLVCVSIIILGVILVLFQAFK